jgi:hypothetical protein
MKTQASAAKARSPLQPALVLPAIVLLALLAAGLLRLNDSADPAEAAPAQTAQVATAAAAFPPEIPQAAAGNAGALAEPARVAPESAASSADEDPDPYEIRGFITEPDQEGMVHPVRAGIVTAADLEPDPEDQDGDKPEEEPASLPAARKLPAATGDKQPGPSAAAGLPVATSVSPPAPQAADAAAGDCPVASSAAHPLAWAELPPALRTTADRPAISIASYDRDPQRRFVISQDRMVREGGRLANGAQLAAVKSGSVVIRAHGCWIELSNAQATR